MALVITKAYASGSILLEAHLDNFRNGLLTFFNTDKIGSASFAATIALTSAKFSGTELTSTDAVELLFGTDGDGTIQVDASKNLIFNTTVATTTLTFIAGAKTMVFKTTQVDVPGDIIIAGGASVGVLHLLSQYRKPVLVYAGSSTISVENNSGTTNQTIVAVPKYVFAVTEALSGSEKYRKMSLANVANGHDATHTGAAQGGRRSGVSLTTNSWYAIYAARVRYGTNAGNNFILIADTIFPTQDNTATLDSRYGAGEYVYLGLIRYGFGVLGSSSSIVPFIQTNKGWTYFTQGEAGTTTSGLTLAYSITNADDAPFYTVSDSFTGSALPCGAITRAQWNMNRWSSTDWAIRDASDVVIWRGGWSDPTLSTTKPHGHLVVTNVQVGMDFTQTRVVTGATDKRMALVAFCDKYVNHRRNGHGV